MSYLRHGKYLFYAGLVVLLVLSPSLLMRVNAPHWISVLTQANFLAVFAMSWDILSGYTGQISFGHAFFIGAAGYTSALLNFHLKLPLWLSIPAGVIAAVLMGLFVAVPALRLRGPYFSLMTLILPIVAMKFVLIFSNFTGGELGQFGLTPLSRARGFLAHQRVNYFYSLGLMLLTAVVLLLIARSKVGKVFEAIRENEEAVEAAGINTAKYKILSFIISSLIAGLGGALYVHYWESLIPSTILTLTLSVQLIVAAVAGGMGTISGPLVGAYLLVGGQEWFKELAALSPSLGFLEKWNVLIFLVILILLIFFARRGLLPALYSLWARVCPPARRAK
ncbi:MAG: branched-chain amino acid ABC transporter permease [Candidatus Acetothermia bacterium]|nr:branched-chain amino acid ABC transporter permease [Candidatus Acetothermia bacterium]MDH7504712.1 branched-chain amino acid ABC transporter permease [Candidatus Acetothermia bacterium]